MGWACQPNITKPNVRASTNASIRAANRWGVVPLFKKRALQSLLRWDRVIPDWCSKGFGGVLLEIPNGVIKEEGKDSIYVSSCYMDATEVCNLHYRSFLQWNAMIYASSPHVYESLLPDTSIWLEHFPKETIGGLLKEYYFRNAAFDYYPVVGVSWEQAQAYALWRTDRINEAILIERKHINPNFEGQQEENHFDSESYLVGLYEAEPGSKPMVNAITGEERRVNASDEILVPAYRLPTSSELKQAAKHVRGYKKNKALDVFKEKVLAHEKIHPKPAFYDHEQYNLPYSIIRDREEGRAPYHLNDTIEEWTQLHPTTNDRYNKSHYDKHHCKEGLYYRNHPPYYIPMWVIQSQRIWMNTDHPEWYSTPKIKLDTALANSFAKQHHIDNTTPYKSFRCVLPNLW